MTAIVGFVLASGFCIIGVRLMAKTPYRKVSKEGLAKIREANRQRFIDKATAKHKGRFDYSKIDYVDQKTEVAIYCPTHDDFKQTPDKHLQSPHGCQDCAKDAARQIKIQRSERTFRKAFEEKFSGRLKLASPFEGMHERIFARCLIHDLKFPCLPQSLLSAKHGCPDCIAEATGQRSRLDPDVFLTRLSTKFPALDLSKTRYMDAETQVTITCPNHGDQTVWPRYLQTSSFGCPKCGEETRGYAGYRLEMLDAGAPSRGATKIGVLEVEVLGIKSYKLGITSRKLEKRYKDSIKAILFEATLEEYDALKLERHLHGKYADQRDVRIFMAGMRSGKRWAGDSELYLKKAVPKIIDDLTRYVNEIAGNERAFWEKHPILEPPILKVRKVSTVKGEFNEAKPVVCLDTGEEYLSATHAAKAIGTSQGNLSAVCQGLRRVAKGLKFAYKEDFEKGIIKADRPNGREGKYHKAARQVLCVETGEVFDTITEAASVKKCSGSHITSVCKGKRKTAGGFKWRYL